MAACLAAQGMNVATLVLPKPATLHAGRTYRARYMEGTAPATPIPPDPPAFHAISSPSHASGTAARAGLLHVGVRPSSLPLHTPLLALPTEHGAPPYLTPDLLNDLLERHPHSFGFLIMDLKDCLPGKDNAPPSLPPSPPPSAPSSPICLSLRGGGSAPSHSPLSAATTTSFASTPPTAAAP
ncbi:hypothetical protein NSK_005981 [Nannochloropsis salina CCMP1776]|uniref:Uncharacterized protein n=1 Tax=Nannochloropsis salina CCMP1776 TaxID=1027361 RepID=A0A4D9D2B4_9STRA|nr:hypothetical protein NSK_005981 [Nannochloropsis salina CCMP1776]|eukprot:TFJ82788.1 hypothetical protein NSK_005981 [Nannochloropsis salina CCMP1776]